MKNILIPLAPGFEEIETITIVDILRRSGARVSIAGVVEGRQEQNEGQPDQREKIEGKKQREEQAD